MDVVPDLGLPGEGGLRLLGCTQLGGREKVTGEQVEEAGDACEACQEPEPQWQILHGAFQLGMQEDGLASSEAPLARVVQNVVGHAGLVLQGQLGIDPCLCILPAQVVPLHQPCQLCIAVTKGRAKVDYGSQSPSPQGDSGVGSGVWPSQHLPLGDSLSCSSLRSHPARRGQILYH